MLYVVFVWVVIFGLYNWRRAVRAEERLAASVEVLAELGKTPATGKRDPGKQALEMLQRGDDCEWYSITHNDNEMHEAFDCLEIYWRTEVERSDRNELGYGRGPFESKAGFRVRWRVAATHRSYVEAYGIDLMSTILEARELADRSIRRNSLVTAMERKHSKLEDWKSREDGRKYEFHGLDLEKWRVRLEYPGGNAWAEHEDLEQAVAAALSKGPT